MNIPTEAQEQTALFQWAAMMEGRIPELRLKGDVKIVRTFQKS